MTTALFPRHWGPQGRYYHRVKGTAYGSSAIGESLVEYKDRVKTAYGDLRGVTFHDTESEPLEAYES